MTTIRLNALAVRNVALLRELAASTVAAPAQIAEIARRIERGESNVRRTIKELAADGLAVVETRTLTDDGRAQLAAIDRAEHGDTAAAMPDGMVALTWRQMIPDPNNARRDWDSAEAVTDLESLAASIKDRGLLQNPTVRVADVFDPADWPDDAPLYTLNGGERRWRAIRMLAEAGHWPDDRLILCRVLDGDARAMRRAALAENIQRRDLNPLERAQAYEAEAEDLAAEGVPENRINREIADAVRKSIEHVQQYRAMLAGLDSADLDRLALPDGDPRRLSITEARKKVAAKNSEPPPIELEPDVRLLLAEILHAVRSQARYTYDDIRVGPTIRDDARIPDLIAKGWLRNRPLAPETSGDHLGHFTLSLGYQGEAVWKLFDWNASPDAAERDHGICVEQALVGVPPPEGVYVTPWLNGPFEVTPEGQAAIDAAAEAEAARQAQAEEADRQRAAQEAERAEAARRQAEVAARSRDLFAAARTVGLATPRSAEAVRILAVDADASLPWRMAHNGDVIAADGTLIIGGRRDDRAEARMRLLILAVNSAAGLETPEDEPDPNPTLDEAAFVEAMDVALRACGVDVDQDGEDILAEFLTDNSIQFGDEAFDWTAEGAASLISDHMANAMASGSAAEIFGEDADDADEGEAA